MVKEMFTKLMDSYPEFTGCGGTVAAFVMLSRKSDAQDVRPQVFLCGISIDTSCDTCCHIICPALNLDISAVDRLNFFTNFSVIKSD